MTDGSRGIGRAIVKRLAGDGASVVFSYVANTEAADRVASEVAAAGGRALAVRADQGSLADLGRLSAQAEEWLDGLDIVVINAAGEPPGMIDDVTEETYDRFMAVHAKGPFFLIQYAGRALRGGGRIISISTLNTRLHPPGGGAVYRRQGSARELPGRPGLRLAQRSEPPRRRRLPALSGGGFAARSGAPRASNLV